MGFILILCARPGRWRAGVQHPARKVYPADAFDAAQIEQLRGDPAFTVEFADTEEAFAEPEVAKVPISSAELPTPRRIIGGVVRLFLPGVAEPLLAEMTSMTHAALDARTSPEAFRDQVNDVFARYARADDEIPGEGRSGTASSSDVSELAPGLPNSGTPEVGEAPSAGSGPEAAVSADATGGAQPAAPHITSPAAAGDTEGAADGAGLNPASPSEGAEPEAVPSAASGTAAPADPPKTSTRKTAKGKA